MFNVGGTFAELLRQLAEEFNHPESVALLGLALTGLGLGLVFSARRRTPQDKRSLSTSAERR